MAANHQVVESCSLGRVLCWYNSILVFAGILMIYRGTKAIAMFEDFDYFLVPIQDYLLPVTLLNIVGVLNIVIALFGFYGAIKESTCMILLFTVFVFIVLILEVPVAILVYGIQYGTENYTAQIMADSMTNYESSPADQVALDYMHSTLRCCGLKDAGDWDYILHNKSVYRYPISCCINEIIQENGETFCGGAYELGCLDKLTMVVEEMSVELSFNAMMIASMQMQELFFAWSFLYYERLQKTD